MIGRVKWINNFKGYGELQDNSGTAFYFLISDIADKIKENDLVFFRYSTKFKLFGSPKVTHLLTLSKEDLAKVQKSNRNEEMELP